MGREESDLPRTPTAVGRMPPIKNLGYEVDFTDLWPLMVGGLGSAFLAVLFLTGFRPLPWPLLAVVAGMPLALAHLYIKKLIEKALPHHEECWGVLIVSKRLVFRRDGPWFMVLAPRIEADDAIASSPPSTVCRSPLLRMTDRLNSLNEPARPKGAR
jgi:hypothetical protein